MKLNRRHRFHFLRQIQYNLTKRLDSKQIEVLTQWEKVLFFIACEVFVMMLFGLGHPPIGLSQPEAHGHLLWFLVLLSLPMLPVYGLLNLLTFHSFEEFFKTIVYQYQFIVLGLNVLFELLILVLLGRWLFNLKTGAYAIELARNSLWLVFYYGVIQFVCFLVMFIWGHGGFNFCF